MGGWGGVECFDLMGWDERSFLMRMRERMLDVCLAVCLSAVRVSLQYLR